MKKVQLLTFIFEDFNRSMKDQIFWFLPKRKTFLVFFWKSLRKLLFAFYRSENGYILRKEAQISKTLAFVEKTLFVAIKKVLKHVKTLAESGIRIHNSRLLNRGDTRHKFKRSNQQFCKKRSFKISPKKELNNFQSNFFLDKRNGHIFHANSRETRIFYIPSTLNNF